jgi:hypothetical protein
VGKWVRRLKEQSNLSIVGGNGGISTIPLKEQFNTSNCFGNVGNFDNELYEISKITKDNGNVFICLMELQLHNNVSIVSGNGGSSEVSEPGQLRDFNCLNLERRFDWVNLLSVIDIFSSVSSKLSRYALVTDENLGRHDILRLKLSLSDKKELYFILIS